MSITPDLKKRVREITTELRELEEKMAVNVEPNSYEADELEYLASAIEDLDHFSGA